MDSVTVEEHRTVSEEAAAAMAERAPEHARRAPGETAMGMSITGFAGPGGGTQADPVGTVCFGLADARGSEVRKRGLATDRERVRRLGVRTALDILRRAMLGIPNRKGPRRRSAAGSGRRIPDTRSAARRRALPPTERLERRS